MNCFVLGENALRQHLNKLGYLLGTASECLYSLFG